MYLLVTLLHKGFIPLIIPFAPSHSPLPHREMEDPPGKSRPNQGNNILSKIDSPSSSLEKEKPSKSGVMRHGARNQNRHRVFVKWILQTFPQEVLSSSINPPPPSSSNTGELDTISQPSNSSLHPFQTPTRKLFLDIAGGKGELTLRLSICHSIQTVLIDPRIEDLIQCFDKDIYKSLPKKWQESITRQRLADEQFLIRRLQQRTFHIPQYFNLHNVTKNCPELLWAIQHASILLGLHADGATEDIVDVALMYRKPFVVVPCCVFPNFTTPRWLYVKSDTVSTTTNTLDKRENKVLVRNYNQFCEYLLQKDSHFQKSTLNFDGRNVAIWWDGKCCDQDVVDGEK